MYYLVNVLGAAHGSTNDDGGDMISEERCHRKG